MVKVSLLSKIKIIDISSHFKWFSNRLDPRFSEISEMHHKYHPKYPVKREFGNLPKCITNQIVNLRLNCLPGVLSWDLGLSNIFGCCLVNSCGGQRKGEPVQSWVHLGKSTIPGCEKGCQIGTL